MGAFQVFSNLFGFWAGGLGLFFCLKKSHPILKKFFFA
jgi:hypothetical protein